MNDREATNLVGGVMLFVLLLATVIALIGKDAYPVAIAMVGLAGTVGPIWLLFGRQLIQRGPSPRESVADPSTTTAE